MRNLIPACLLIALLSACGPRGDDLVNNAKETASKSAPDFADAKLTKNEVINLARKIATREGHRVGDYKAPAVDYKPSKKEGSWVLYYERDVQYQYPGSCFYVFVNDATREARVVPCE